MPKIQANNINLYYELSGEGHPLVFIHGLGSSTLDWECQVPVFSNHYGVVTFDLRGHGRSDKPEGPYDIPLFATDLDCLLQALGIRSAHIAGLSLGGAVAFQFVIDNPESVKTLTIINSGPTLSENPEVSRQTIEDRVGLAQQLGMRGLGQFLSEGLFPKPEHVSLREKLIERWSRNDPQAYIDAVRAWSGWNVMSKLGSIQTPTLVMTADQDKLWPISVKEAYVKLMPNARLVVIPESHHAMTLERPEKVNEALMTFLAQCDAE